MRTVGEVEHPRRRVREHEAERRDGVDAADDQPADDVGRHRVPLLSVRVDRYDTTAGPGRVDPAPAVGCRCRCYGAAVVAVGAAVVVVGTTLVILLSVISCLAQNGLPSNCGHELLVLDVHVVHARGTACRRPRRSRSSSRGRRRTRRRCSPSTRRRLLMNALRVGQFTPAALMPSMMVLPLSHPTPVIWLSGAFGALAAPSTSCSRSRPGHDFAA